LLPERPRRLPEAGRPRQPKVVRLHRKLSRRPFSVILTKGTPYTMTNHPMANLSVSNNFPNQLRFGADHVPFSGATLDIDRGELRMGNKVLALRPKAFRLLLYFAQNPGRLLTKNALMANIWPNAVVTDDSLTQCVAQLRTAVGDTDQHAIKTVRGRGYIFDAELPMAALSASPAKTGEIGAKQQQIRFCTSFDGVQLAFATVGQGPHLVEVGTWINHLESDWDSPVWSSRLHRLASLNQLLRYDCRGCGMSDHVAADFSFEAMLGDLEAVVDAAALDRFALSAPCGGAAVAIAYAARHPKRVSSLVLYGPFARGRLAGSPSALQCEEAAVMRKLIEIGWGRENPVFREVFTRLFIPDCTPQQYQWFTELQRITTSPENAARLTGTYESVDVRGLLGEIQCPTLVFHSRYDARVPFEQGRLIASGIKGARLIPLESRNHILLEQDPAWRQLLDEMQKFVNQTADLPIQTAQAEPVQARAIKHLKVAAMR
jgi:DNA-binding winged helix-turn-helix (wHTH) protein/pimeloyl-ACP methyl ester carboxylesterase